MKIEGRDITEIQRVLKEHLERGDRFYIHDSSNERLRANDLLNYIYKDKFDAMLYADVLSDQTSTMRLVLPLAEIASQINQMTELQQLIKPAKMHSLTIEIDEYLLVRQEAVREEMAIRDLKRQMADVGFIPDAEKVLIEHVELDTLRFTLTGMHQTGDGVHQRYTALIAQDQDRVFHIMAYAPELTARLSQLGARMNDLKTDGLRTAQDWSIDGKDEQERRQISKVWKLVDELHLLYAKGPEEQKGVKALLDRYWSTNPLKDVVDPFVIIPKNRASEETILQVSRQLEDQGLDSTAIRHTNEFTLEALALGFYQKVSLPDQPLTTARFDPDTRELTFYDNNFQPVKYKTMNEKNEEYLQKQLKWVGFGDNLNEPLRVKLKEGSAEFILTHQTKFGKDEVAAVLHFSKSKDAEIVFFNRYQVAMLSNDKDQAIKQTFYIRGKEDNITLKEAYNQLSGRAVYREMSPKEGDKYMAWEQLNFKETDKYGNFKTKQFNENYGYDLAATLAKYPIKELNFTDAQERLIDSLQRGNRQQVTLAVEGKEQKISVEAVPQWKSLDFYNEAGKRLDIKKVLDGLKPEQLSQAQSNSPEQKKGTAQKSSPLDDEGAPAKKQGRKKGLSA